MYKIEWKGEGIIKHGSRGKWKPIGIGEHISIGTLQSMYYTFSNASNGRSASAHFGVGRKGEIWQYVDIKRAAWTQGISDSAAFNRSTAPIVKANKDVNPNLYLVSIEHEGYYEGYTENGEVILENHGADGDLTEEQFWSTCWLHKYIQEEVFRLYGETFSLNPYSTPGHYQIDPKRKPNCPGPKFPWDRLYKELAVMDKMTLEEYEEHITYMQSPNSEINRLFALYTRAVDLKNKLVGKHKDAAEFKIMKLADAVLKAGGYQGEITPLGIVSRIIELYNKRQEKGQFANEATRKLLLILKEAELAKVIA